MHKLIKNEIGEHYLLMLCPAHKIELAIENAFELSALNNDCNTDYVNIFYLFKKANLRWRLFKRQSILEGIPYIHYKRPSSTRWVKHQSAALNLHINSLLIFIGFHNNQILNPYNEWCVWNKKSNFWGYQSLIYFVSLSLLVKHFRKLLF